MPSFISYNNISQLDYSCDAAETAALLHVEVHNLLKNNFSIISDL
jgi:hypothetical protein